jgi:hypothetical protein
MNDYPNFSSSSSDLFANNDDVDDHTTKTTAPGSVFQNYLYQTRIIVSLESENILACTTSLTDGNYRLSIISFFFFFSF